MYPMEKVLSAHQADVDSVRFQQLGPAEVLTSLKNGGVDAAWLLDPVWRQVDGDADYAFLGGQPRGEPLGGLLFGPDLLTWNPDAGVAFLRADIRTVNTYFAGDYKKDAVVPRRPRRAQDRAGHTGRRAVAAHGLGDP
ncbi:hypothetical protein SANTM175S_10667 [Streptomyces antimycoticus]